MRACGDMDLSSSVQLGLPRVADQIEREKITSMSPNPHVLFCLFHKH